ncbi:hypothetical protein G7Y79_00027g060930 [Physcia stellaris]|nr:hypothetical protein G7Y79_00027g060930 [Physcia stellaris]
MPICFDYALNTVAVPKSPVPAMGYFALPGEIRNKIMKLVLCPGHIYLRSKPTASNHHISYSNDPAGATRSPPGIQLLATCRQAYNEGRVLYYSGNVFHLPPGPVSATEAMLNKMQPESLSLIRRVNLTVSLLDLASLIEEVENKASQESDYRNIASMAFCSLVWAKAFFLTTRLPGLRAVKYEVVFFEGLGIRGLSSNGWQPLLERHPIRSPLYPVAIRVAKIAREVIRDLGWEVFKASLSPGRLQEIEREDLERNVVGVFEFSADTSVLENRLNGP